MIKHTEAGKIERITQLDPLSAYDGRRAASIGWRELDKWGVMFRAGTNFNDEGVCQRYSSCICGIKISDDVFVERNERTGLIGLTVSRDAFITDEEGMEALIRDSKRGLVVVRFFRQNENSDGGE